ncbi:hypothetical protein [Ruegeria sp. HKCCD8929]|uniref:hypothetical protein n=1 Tax=Ruegeria sp. HKCCD8929 TaxID=2683006 RepID=UPI001488D313|nr:hypothetical protein [Ruegeria sp. HKCCD8929]
MTLVEWFKLLWPVGVTLVVFGVRLEVGQVLNKHRWKTVEKEIERNSAETEKDVNALHARISRHEAQTNSTLSEIRNDIKTLLARGI